MNMTLENEPPRQSSYETSDGGRRTDKVRNTNRRELALLNELLEYLPRFESSHGPRSSVMKQEQILPVTTLPRQIIPILSSFILTRLTQLIPRASRAILSSTAARVLLPCSFPVILDVK